VRFADRADAGRQLAARLQHLRGQRVVVLGLPRGGVPVAFEVARALGAPLDVIVVRKLGVPFQAELGMGAIGEDGVRVLNQKIMQWGGISADELAAVEARERRELERRAFRYRRGRSRQPLGGCVAVVVDDGIATGSTARAACQVARAQGAARVVLAVPVAPPGWRARMGHDADELVCVQTPRSFSAIGRFYADFAQTTDDEVTACLDRAASPVSLPGPAAAPVPVPGPGAAPVGDPPDWDEDVEVSAGAVRLAGSWPCRTRRAGSWCSRMAAAAAGTAPGTATWLPY
jgi:putative phosphoribosyl transferase